MKNKYIIYISGIIVFILIISLYFIEIPNPSKKYSEPYEIQIK